MSNRKHAVKLIESCDPSDIYPELLHTGTQHFVLEPTSNVKEANPNILPEVVIVKITDNHPNEPYVATFDKRSFSRTGDIKRAEKFLYKNDLEKMTRILTSLGKKFELLPPVEEDTGFPSPEPGHTGAQSAFEGRHGKIPPNIVFTDKSMITTWYDENTKSYVTQLIDPNGNQVGDAQYDGNTDDMLASRKFMMKDKMKELGIPIEEDALTDLEKEMIKAIWDAPDSPGDPAWVFTALDKFQPGGKIGRGVLSSLTKKNYATIFDYEGDGKQDDMVIELTAKGKDAAKELGLVQEIAIAGRRKARFTNGLMVVPKGWDGKMNHIVHAALFYSPLQDVDREHVRSELEAEFGNLEDMGYELKDITPEALDHFNKSYEQGLVKMVEHKHINLTDKGAKLVGINLNALKKAAKKITHCGDYGQLFVHPSGKVHWTMADSDGRPEFTSSEEIKQLLGSVKGVLSVEIGDEWSPNDEWMKVNLKETTMDNTALAIKLVEGDKPLNMYDTIMYIKKDGDQWMYKIVSGGRTKVDWQYGPYEKDLMISQAKSRFGNVDKVIELNKAEVVGEGHFIPNVPNVPITASGHEDNYRKNDNEVNYETIKASELVVGDVVNINTGYRPLDDEDCKVLSLSPGTDVFGGDRINASVRIPGGKVIDTDFTPDSNVLIVARKNVKEDDEDEDEDSPFDIAISQAKSRFGDVDRVIELNKGETEESKNRVSAQKMIEDEDEFAGDDEVTHDSIARDVEQALPGVSYCEMEGPNSTRVDFNDGTSIWFNKDPDGISVSGNVSKRTKKSIDAFLKDFSQVKNQIEAA